VVFEVQNIQELFAYFYVENTRSQVMHSQGFFAKTSGVTGHHARFPESVFDASAVMVVNLKMLIPRVNS
jgi:hypothetical protein